MYIWKRSKYFLFIPAALQGIVYIHIWGASLLLLYYPQRMSWSQFAPNPILYKESTTNFSKPCSIHNIF